jgi:RNA polymerase sigma factor (sigma-70 family)
MASKTLTDVVCDLGRAARLQAALALPDAQLLERFALRRDEAAFEALLHRHGPLVFGVCRRLLYEPHDAEDAFQATFLVLARKAGAVGRRAPLGNWLYGVAYRVAARLRKNVARRRGRHQNGIDLDAVPEAEQCAPSDLAPLLFEEVQRLPDKYRRPVVLCYLEGKTNEEAADRLCWPVGTVKGRLHRARELLRVRLTRRGVALSAGALTAALAPAAAPAALLDATAQAALTYLAGGAVSASVASLTKGVLQTMFLRKLKHVAALVLAVAVLGGVGGFVYRALASEPTPAPPDTPKLAEPQGTPKLAAPAPARDQQPQGDKDALQGVWKLAQIEGGPAAKIDVEFDRWVITAKEITYGEDRVIYTYTVDPTGKPKTLDLTYVVKGANGQLYQAIYELAGDTLKVRIPRLPEMERPATMEPDNDAFVYTFRRKQSDKAQADQKALQGTWTVRTLIADGTDASERGTEDDFGYSRGSKWVIVDDILTVLADKGGERFRFTLDPMKEPRTIDLLDLRYQKEKGTTYLGFEKLVDHTVRGIYALDGDTWTICLGGPNRPPELASKKGSRTTLVVLRHEPREDRGKVLGTWKVSKIRAGGKDVTGEAGEPRLLAQARWVITADKLAIHAAEKDFEFTYRLDPAATPKAIDLTLTAGPEDQKGKTRQCAYAIEDETLKQDETLKLCLPFEPGAKRPTEVLSREGDKTMLIVLQRDKSNDAKPDE